MKIKKKIIVVINKLMYTFFKFLQTRCKQLTKLLAGFNEWPMPWKSTGACGKFNKN